MASLIKFKASAPGKVILLGEHSVVFGKTALAASLSLRTKLSFKENDGTDKLFRLSLPAISLVHECSFDDIVKLFKDCLPPVQSKQKSHFSLESPQFIDFKSFVSTLQAKISKIRGGVKLEKEPESALTAFFFLFFGMLSAANLSIVPVSIEITSDLVLGAGTGSSASYGACMATAFYHYIRSRVARDGNLGKNISKKGFDHFVVDITDMSTFNDRELGIILSWASISDKIMHGETASGIDASVVTYGSVIEFRRGAAGEPSFIKRLPGASALKVLLVNSGITRDTKKMVLGVDSLHQAHPLIVDPILVAMDEVALAGKAVFERMQMMQWSMVTVISLRSERPKQEAHAEPGRHSEESLNCENIDHMANTLGDLMKINQSLLCALGVSHPTLDQICSIAAKNGNCAKLTGAGGGGYAIILLPPQQEQAKTTALQAELKAKGYESTFALMGGAGVILEEV